MLPSPHLQLSILNNELKDKLYRDIVTFRETYGLSVAAPEAFNEECDTIHTSLFIEELRELADAKSRIEIADSIADQIFVLVGRVVEHGQWSIEIEYIVDVLLQVSNSYDFDFVAIWDEVLASNLSKACQNWKQFEDTAEHYRMLGVKVEAVEHQGAYVVKCAEDCIYQNSQIKKGKVLKSIYYRPADLTFVGN